MSDADWQWRVVEAFAFLHAQDECIGWTFAYDGFARCGRCSWAITSRTELGDAAARGRFALAALALVGETFAMILAVDNEPEVRAMLGLAADECPTLRPCRRADCPMHLAHEEAARAVTPAQQASLARKIQRGFPALEETCALDVARRGEHTAAELVPVLRVSKRQVERQVKAAEAAMAAAAGAHGLDDEEIT